MPELVGLPVEPGYHTHGWVVSAMDHLRHARTGRGHCAQQLKSLRNERGVANVLGHASRNRRVKGFRCLDITPVLSACNPRTEPAAKLCCHVATAGHCDERCTHNVL